MTRTYRSRALKQHKENRLLIRGRPEGTGWGGISQEGWESASMVWCYPYWGSRRQVVEGAGGPSCAEAGKFGLNSAEPERGKEPHTQGSVSQGKGEIPPGRQRPSPQMLLWPITCLWRCLGGRFFFHSCITWNKEVYRLFSVSFGFFFPTKLLDAKRMQCCPLAPHLDRALTWLCLSGDLEVSHRQSHEPMNIRSQGASGGCPWKLHWDKTLRNACLHYPFQ